MPKLYNHGLLIIVICLILFSISNCKKVDEAPESTLQITQISTKTTALLQAFALDNDGRIWVSGHNATYGFSTDEGNSWQFEQLIFMPEDSSLQFRDIAVTSNAVFLMSAGNGPESRIYRREKGEGTTWVETFRGEGEEVFLNSLAFFNANHGLAYGDSFKGELYLLETKDGGLSWQQLEPTLLPTALEGEGGFASSGSCIQVLDEQTAMIATGNAEKARLLVTKDAGKSWEVEELGIAAGTAMGATGVVFGANETAWIFGGDLNSPKSGGDRVQMYHLGMQKLFDATDPGIEGALYGFTYFEEKSSQKEQLFAANPNGLFVSGVDNFSWSAIDTMSYWALISTEKHIFAAGPNGRIVKLYYSTN